MTVSTSNIWKSASASLRQPVGVREAKLHIGDTLRDLYAEAKTPKTDGRFSDLLRELETIERGPSRQ